MEWGRALVGGIPLGPEHQLTQALTAGPADVAAQMASRLAPLTLLLLLLLAPVSEPLMWGGGCRVLTLPGPENQLLGFWGELLVESWLGFHL